jgi:hypothetical protein
VVGQGSLIQIAGYLFPGFMRECGLQAAISGQPASLPTLSFPDRHQCHPVPAASKPPAPTAPHENQPDRLPSPGHRVPPAEPETMTDLSDCRKCWQRLALAADGPAKS